MPGGQLGAPGGATTRSLPGCSLRDRRLSGGSCRRSPRDFPWLCRLIMNTCPAVESSQFCAGHPGSAVRPGQPGGLPGRPGPQDRPRSGGSTRVERVIPGPLGHPEPVGSSHTNRGFSVFTFNPAHIARRASATQPGVRNPTDPGQPGKPGPTHFFHGSRLL